MGSRLLSMKRSIAHIEKFVSMPEELIRAATRRRLTQPSPKPQHTFGKKGSSSDSTRTQKSNPSNKGKTSKLPSRVDLNKQAIQGPHKLAALKVTQRTLDKYLLEIERFKNWLVSSHGKNPSFRDVSKLDRQVSFYMNYLHDELETETHHAAYLIYGLQLLHSTGPKEQFLCRSKDGLAGWRMQKPGKSRLPMPEECIFVVASDILDQGRADVAMAMILQYHCYLRPSEVLGLTKDHVASPSVGKYKKWGLIIAPFDLGVASKNGAFDDAVLIADIPGFDWIALAMKLFMQQREHDLFPACTLAQYEDIITKTARKLRYSDGVFVPHVLRHSGPSCDHFHGRRDLTAIQRRGRWLAKASVRRYEKHAILIRQWRTVPSARHDGILRQSQNFPSKFLQTLRRNGCTKTR